MLDAGTLDPRTNQVSKTKVGTPQGNVISPILCNIVLHKLDEFMEDLKNRYVKGKTRRESVEYRQARKRREYARTPELKAQHLQEMRKLPKYDSLDPEFRRLTYVRYADDFVILTAGTKSEAKCIKHEVASFLKQACGLSLNPDKTAITNLTET